MGSFNRKIYTRFWKPNFIILARKGWGPNISGCKKYNGRFKFQNSRLEMHGPLNCYTETQYSDQIKLLYIYITLQHFFLFQYIIHVQKMVIQSNVTVAANFLFITWLLWTKVPRKATNQQKMAQHTWSMLPPENLNLSICLKQDICTS